MNVADSQRLASALEKLGVTATEQQRDASIVVLNTCVVRQSAEDKALSWIHYAKKLKAHQPELILGVMGCLVGVRGNHQLAAQFPYIDVFMAPSDPQPMVDYLLSKEGLVLTEQQTEMQHLLLDGDLVLPQAEVDNLVAAHVPIVYGCSHACTFCIIPFRRGIERSRSIGEIAAEVRSLTRQGVREVTLLGQIVDRYGYDVPDGPNLAQLLRVLHEIPDLARIRFLTSHPNYMTDELLQTVADLPKVAKHIEVPVQAGSDKVLDEMRRGYTSEQYRALVARIRATIPQVGIATDIIVGFPGESEADFQQTYDLLADLKLDKVHIAKYSPREGTVSARRMDDDVPADEKERRRKALDDLQKQILTEKHAELVGQVFDVLVEERHKDKWRGRTTQNKLVFIDSDVALKGEIVAVRITHSGPWSLQAEPVDVALARPAETIPLPVLG